MNVRHMRGAVLAASMVAMLAMLPAGCNDDNPNTSDLDGYFENNPYVSDPRSTPTRVVSIAPESATLNTVGARAVFTATGGTSPYKWDVANGSVGSISPSGGSEAIYTATSIGANDVIVSDRNGNAAIAHISGTTVAVADLVVSANPATLTTDLALSVLTVTGGTAPYTWDITFDTRGAFRNGNNTGENVVYKRLSSGNNAVTVHDGSGKSKSLVISQPP